MGLAHWLTLLMAAVTAWMAWETRRMARVAQASFGISTTPYLALSAMLLSEDPLVDSLGTGCSTQATVTLKNPGNVRVLYDVEVAELRLRGTTSPQAPYDNHAGVIHPGEEVGFRLHPMKLEDGLKVEEEGAIEFRVRYRGPDDQPHALSCSLTFKVTGVDPTQVEWAFRDGPRYM